MLNRISLTKDDQLFLLGDYVSRGESSSKVLDIILKLKREKYNVFPIRGNHEQMILDRVNGKPQELSWLAQKFQYEDLLVGKNRIKGKYLYFMRMLPYYIELDKYFLVHAGFDFSHEKPLEDYESMVWTTEVKYDSKKANKKRIIHGHKTRSLQAIENSIFNKENVIGLDNGCVYYGTIPGRGYLLCLELDSNRLIKEKKLEGSIQID